MDITNYKIKNHLIFKKYSGDDVLAGKVELVKYQTNKHDTGKRRQDRQ